jgi:hypothetical protein
MALAMARAGVKLVLSGRREHELERVKKNCVREYSTHYAGVTSSLPVSCLVVSWYWWLVLGLGGCLKQLTAFSVETKDLWN